FDSLDALAFAQGPGSYTALRITASFLKPIAVVKNLPLIPISNLKALAHEAAQWIDEDEAEILVALEADQNESYFGVFTKSLTGIESVGQELVTSFEELDAYQSNSSSYFIGSGWSQTIDSHSRYLALAQAGAESVAALAKIELETGKTFDPELANPVYLKTPEYQKK
ncbi:tRNA (adenosine(37)-N6)-threonylcarbamoyltransferase complex dimerization subunit type 1 TsaB, partial [Gammaproteobacteria bacterium]|nr:tRNA (adenosine(37)-N6)-threonylcarbamoyltransferase complex dimerization subunit type 1 TsaB [Gammaproteobacteria bacterium]